MRLFLERTPLTRQRYSVRNVRFAVNVLIAANSVGDAFVLIENFEKIVSQGAIRSLRVHSVKYASFKTRSDPLVVTQDIPFINLLKQMQTVRESPRAPMTLISPGLS